MKKRTKVPWEEFRYNHIETGWFGDDRPKTLAAMKQLWSAMPQSDIDRLPELLLVFAPTPYIDGEGMPFADSGIEREGIFIYLSPGLEKKSQNRVNSIVAHEFAHAVLGHRSISTRGIKPSELPEHWKDTAHEIE